MSLVGLLAWVAVVSSPGPFGMETLFSISNSVKKVKKMVTGNVVLRTFANGFVAAGSPVAGSARGGEMEIFVLGVVLIASGFMGVCDCVLAGACVFEVEILCLWIVHQ
jgi:hypothetical protein